MLKRSSSQQRFQRDYAGNSVVQDTTSCRISLFSPLLEPKEEKQDNGLSSSF